VVTGVSANADLFARAREENVDLVLVHHGPFWAGSARATSSRWPLAVRPLSAAL